MRSGFGQRNACPRRLISSRDASIQSGRFWYVCQKQQDRLQKVLKATRKRCL